MSVIEQLRRMLMLQVRIKQHSYVSSFVLLNLLLGWTSNVFIVDLEYAFS